VESITAIENEFLDALGIIRRSVIGKDGLGCIEKELKRRQSLLSVNDEVLGHHSGSGLARLEHDRAQEVTSQPGVVFGRFAVESLDYSEDVVPERLPLIFFRPNVRALKGRNLVTDR
jgi:hypothetical protein